MDAHRNPRTTEAFFYGLFMDADVLREKGVVARNPRLAWVEGFGLRIGQRATLIPESGVRAYGILYSLTHAELENLYAGPGLEQYRPEAVLAQIANGSAVPALCFNLEVAPAPHEANPEYARRLRAIAARLGLPADYVQSIS